MNRDVAGSRRSTLRWIRVLHRVSMIGFFPTMIFATRDIRSSVPGEPPALPALAVGYVFAGAIIHGMVRYATCPLCGRGYRLKKIGIRSTFSSRCESCGEVV